MTLRYITEANLPTEFGDFRLVGFSPDERGREHVAVVRGDLEGAERVAVRIHSECLTGDALGSLRCDCRAQLQLALKELGRSECGVVLYLRQEGRDIGLLNKVRAYALQDQGIDTVDANRMLGFRDDARDYQIAADMLNALGVGSIRLKTNNPDKLEQLERYGIQVEDRIPHETQPTHHNVGYLDTKRRRCRHRLTLLEAS